MKPIIKNTCGGVDVQWPELDVLIRFERLVEKSDGVNGEVTPIINGANSSIPLCLTTTRINLLGARARTEWTTRLKKSAPTVPWDDFIEQTIQAALKNFRRGEPAVLLDSNDYAPKDAIISPLTYANLISTIYANGGSGKSVLALFLTLCVEAGVSLFNFTVPRALQSIYLDWELDLPTHGYRKKLILREHPQLDTPGPLYRRMYRPLADELSAIRNLIEEHDIQFLVIDSLAQAVGGDQLGAEHAIRFYEALRVLNVSVLILAHSPKNSENKGIYGNVFHFNLSRSVWEIRGTQEEASRNLHLGLFHKKNNLGRLHSSIGLRIVFPEEGAAEMSGIEFQPLDLDEDPELSQGLPLKKRLLHNLKRGPKTIKQLSEELDVKVETIKARLYEGSGKDFMKVKKSGAEWMWGLQEK